MMGVWDEGVGKGTYYGLFPKLNVDTNYELVSESIEAYLAATSLENYWESIDPKNVDS